MFRVGTSELQQEFRVHVLEMPDGDGGEESTISALALIILKRQNGLLLAVPQGFFSEETLSVGLMATAEDQIGQSCATAISAGSLEHFEGTEQPVPVAEALVDVVLIDVSSSIQEHLKPYSLAEHSGVAIFSFNSEDPALFPLADDLTMAAWAWVQDPSSGERANFYSAEEEGGGATPRPMRREQRQKQVLGVVEAPGQRVHQQSQSAPGRRLPH